MNTLVCSHRLSLLRLPNQSPWHPFSVPKTLLRIENVQNQSNPPRKRSLQANAKGFTGIPPAAAIQEQGTNLAKRQSNQSNEDDEPIPQEVFERMMVRIVVSVGAPLALGLGIAHLFGVVKEQHLWDFPKWIPFLLTFLAFGASALGIAYGALSTSWDVNEKGSFFGLEQAQKNWADMWREEDKAQNRNSSG